jgi:hypothetical protein
MGGVREKGVSSVHAAVSVDGVVRIGKSQPFTNEVEWDGEDAMDLLFDVPNAGTDVEVIIYLNENKEVGTNPKSQIPIFFKDQTLCPGMDACKARPISSARFVHPEKA